MHVYIFSKYPLHIPKRLLLHSNFQMVVDDDYQIKLLLLLGPNYFHKFISRCILKKKNHIKISL